MFEHDSTHSTPKSEDSLWLSVFPSTLRICGIGPIVRQVWERVLYPLSQVLSCVNVLAFAACTFGVLPKKSLPDPTS